MRREIEGTVMTDEVWHKSRRADGGLMEPLSGFMAFSRATQGRTVRGVEAGRFNPGLDYGILSGSPAIADATIFVAP